MNNLDDFLPIYEKALATQEWDVVAPLIHRECVATFSEGTYHGKAEVEGAYRKTFELIKDERYIIHDIHWVARLERMATCVYLFSWSGVIGGERASGSGRGTSVLINEGEGWQLICEHLGPPARHSP